VSTPDLDKHGISVGLSTTWYGITFALAGQYVLMDELTVTNSERTLTGPLGGHPDKTTVVGNGTYRANVWYASLGLSFSLDSYFDGEEERSAEGTE